MRIGIRKEDKNRWERRTPLTPDQVGRLIEDHGLEFTVQASDLRVFPDEQYRAAGAEIVQEQPDTPIVMGVKEIPVAHLAPGKTYVFFSHTIKGQPYNMPMLRRIMELGCTLVDYERIVDEHGRRLVFFGRYAGLAGMMDTLWALGRRLEAEGLDTPLAQLQPTHRYQDLEAVKAEVRRIGRELVSKGIPESLRPFVVGFTGYGNVSRGAQEILDGFDPVEITPDALLAGDLPGDQATTVYKVVFKEQDMVLPKEGYRFELQDYFQHPEHYVGNFSRFVPKLAVLVNGIYWTEDYPRLVTVEDLAALFSAREQPLLRVIGDISCDVAGSMECTVECTTPDDPIYLYDPIEREARSGVEGRGVVVQAVDNLPCELPADASKEFGEALFDMVPNLASTDMEVPFEDLALDPRLKRAVIVHRGELTPQYEYLKEHLDAHA